MAGELDRDLAVVHDVERLLVAQLGPLDGENFASIMGVIELTLCRNIIRNNAFRPGGEAAAARLVYGHIIGILGGGDAIMA